MTRIDEWHEWFVNFVPFVKLVIDSVFFVTSCLAKWGSYLICDLSV